MTATTTPAVGAATAPRRLLWMDFLRGLAVALVMVNHSINMAHIQGWPIPEWIMSPTRAFEPFRLPMLLLLSGLFLPRALSKPLGTYVSGKLRNLVWPLVLWAPLVVVTHIPERAGEWAAWIGGPSHLWYLGTLTFCYAVALLSRWVPLWVFPAVFLTVLFSGLSDNVNLLWFGSFFFIGALIQPVSLRFQSRPRWVFALLLATAAVGSYLHVDQVTSGQNLLVLGFALAGALAMIWIAPRLPRVWLVRLLERVGRRSIVYYIVHLPVIALVYRALLPLDLPTPVVIATGAAVGIGASWLVTRIKGHEHLFSFPDLSRRTAATSHATSTAPSPVPRVRTPA